MTLPEAASTSVPNNSINARLELASASDVGCERELNEDTVWAAPFKDDQTWQVAALLIVADGMGGHDAGEVASHAAAQSVREFFTTTQPASPEDLNGQQLLRHAAHAAQSANRAVFNLVSEGGSRPGTTLTFCLVRPQEYFVSHVGDSRAYLIRRSECKQITQDDSAVAEAVRRGHMTEEEARTSEFRNQITKAIGLRDEVEPSVYYGHWQPGDVLLVCSDGLTEYIPPNELLQCAQSGDSLEELCQTLICLANERGGHDNISVAAARYQTRLCPTNTVTPTNGTRKPSTWPPSEPRAEKSTSTMRASQQSSIPWIAIAIVCAVLAAGLGLWWGLKSGRGTDAQRKSTTPTGRNSASKSVTGKGVFETTAPSQPTSAQQALHKAGDIKVSLMPASGKPTRIEIICYGYQIVELKGGLSKSTGEPRETSGPVALTTESGEKGYVVFSNPTETGQELQAGGYYRVYNDKKAKQPLSQRLTFSNRVATLHIPEGRFYIFLTPGNGETLREPTATFRVQLLREAP